LAASARSYPIEYAGEALQIDAAAAGTTIAPLRVADKTPR
jgi:hypothetical protein